MDFCNPEEGSVRLSGPVDPLAQSSIDAVDGVAVKPGDFGCFQNKDDPGNYLPIINTGHTMRQRKERLDLRHLRFKQLEQIRHGKTPLTL